MSDMVPSQKAASSRRASPSLVITYFKNGAEKPQKSTLPLGLLAQYLRLGNIPALHGWRQGPCFRPRYEIFYNRGFLILGGGEQTRNMDFLTVIARITEGELSGQALFSNPSDEEMGDYVLVDWYAWLLLQLKLLNENKNGGIFYPSSSHDFSDHQKYCRLWTAITNQNYHLAPERGGRAAARIFENSSRSTQASSSQGLSSTATASTTSTLPVLPQSAPGAADEDSSDGPDPDDAEEAPAAALTPYQRMKQDAPATFDINHPFWQYNLIERLNDPYGLNKRVPNVAIEQVTDTNVYEVDEETRLRQMIEADRETELVPAVAPATAQDAHAYKTNQKLMDNTRYQPQGHEGACRAVGVVDLDSPDYDHPRFDCMPVGEYFKLHQVVPVHALRKMQRKGRRGGMLADQMGTGKTWIAIGLLLGVSTQQRDTNPY
jgi:hypothetical protein